MHDKTTVETRYFISSLESNGERLANSVRSHWATENSLHWVLDVALKQDDCRIRKDNAPQNFSNIFSSYSIPKIPAFSMDRIINY